MQNKQVEKEIERVLRRMRELERGAEETYYKEYVSLSWQLGGLRATDGCLFQE